MNLNKAKGLLAVALAMGMAASVPSSALAQQVAAESVAVAVEAKGKQQGNGQQQGGGKQFETATQPEGNKAGQKAVKTGKVTCTSAGKLNISFKQKVTYTNDLKAVIKDESGSEIPCKVLKKNKKLLSVSVSGLVSGQKYTVVIEGILGADTNEAVTVVKEFTAKGMKTNCKVGSATVANNKFVILKMQSAVTYKDAVATVTDSKGAACEATIVKKAKGNVKIQIANMQKGETYTITIEGIKTKKEKNFGSITRTVTVK